MSKEEEGTLKPPLVLFNFIGAHSSHATRAFDKRESYQMDVSKYRSYDPKQAYNKRRARRKLKNQG